MRARPATLTMFVGEAPGRSNGKKDRRAFSGRTGKFLADNVAVGWRGSFDLVFNLVQDQQRKSGKGSAFPTAKARTVGRAVLAAALSMNNQRWSRCIVVAAGWRVFKAITGLSHSGTPYFRPVEFNNDAYAPPTFVVCFPHPSGVNRWWNEKDNVAEASAFLERVRRGQL